MPYTFNNALHQFGLHQLYQRMFKTLSISLLSCSCLKFHWPCSELYGFVPFTKCQFGLRTRKIYICPFYGRLPTFGCSCVAAYESCPLSLTLCSESRWFRTTMKGVLSHTREDTFVMIRAGCIVSELHLVTCLFCSKKTKENSLNPMTCCTFDIISYLS